jgi:hypothetical protein
MAAGIQPGGQTLAVAAIKKFVSDFLPVSDTKSTS